MKKSFLRVAIVLLISALGAGHACSQSLSATCTPILNAPIAYSCPAAPGFSLISGSYARLNSSRDAIQNGTTSDVATQFVGVPLSVVQSRVIVQISGSLTLNFDGATTAGDTIALSSITAGYFHGTGSTTCSATTLGVVSQTIGAAGQATAFIGPCAPSAGSGLPAGSTAVVPVLTQTIYAGQSYNDSPQALTVNASTHFPIYIINPGGADNVGALLVQCASLACPTADQTVTDLSTGLSQPFAFDYTNVKQVEPGYIEVQYVDYASMAAQPGLRFIRFNIGAGTWTNNQIDTSVFQSDPYENAFYVDPTDSYRVHSVVTADSGAAIIYCAQAACSSITATNTLPLFTSDTNYVQDVVKGASGFPQALSYNRRLSDGEISNCANLACSSGTAFVVATDFGYYGTLAVGTDGFPRIIYSTVDDAQMPAQQWAAFVACTTVTGSSCSAPVRVVSTGIQGPSRFVGQLSLNSSNIPSFSEMGSRDAGTSSRFGGWTCTNAACGGATEIVSIGSGPSDYYGAYLRFSGTTPVFLATANDASLPAQLWYGQNITQLTLMGQPVSGTQPVTGDFLNYDGLRWSLIHGGFLSNTAVAPELAILGRTNGTFARSMALGNGSFANNTNGCMVIGAGSTCTNDAGLVVGANSVQSRGGSGGTMVGNGNNDGGHSSVFVFGDGVTATADNQFLFAHDNTLHGYVGNPASDGKTPFTLHGHNMAAGNTNTGGGDFTIAGGQSTGSGVGGFVALDVSLPGSSGTAQNPLVHALFADPATSLISALNGFTFAPVAAPGTASSTCTKNQWAFDATHWYVCINTNTWVRTTLATW